MPDNLPKNNVVAELCSAKLNVTYCQSKTTITTTTTTTICSSLKLNITIHHFYKEISKYNIVT
jgi:hypothetical protein